MDFHVDSFLVVLLRFVVVCVRSTENIISFEYTRFKLFLGHKTLLKQYVQTVPCIMNSCLIRKQCKEKNGEFHSFVSVSFVSV